MKIKCPAAHRYRTRLIRDRDHAMAAARQLADLRGMTQREGLIREFVRSARAAQHAALAFTRQDRVQS